MLKICKFTVYVNLLKITIFWNFVNSLPYRFLPKFTSFNCKNHLAVIELFCSAIKIFYCWYPNKCRAQHDLPPLVNKLITITWRTSARSRIWCHIIGPTWNRLRTDRFAAYNHYAIHTYTLFLTCSYQPNVTTSSTA